MSAFNIKSVAILVLLACVGPLTLAHEATKEAAPAVTEPTTKPGYVAAQAAAIPSARAPKHPAPLNTARSSDIIKQLNPQSLKKKPKKNGFPPGTIDLAIAFKGDSDQLEDSSFPLLENLASALQDPRLLPSRYLIEGHTESRGSARYSFVLSKQQANAVHAYLLEHGIEPGRLRSEGKGFKEPQDETNPLASSNHRIRVKLVTDNP
jgi:outer membrane protein OmpA-like peptidoglycan-associated protein